MNKYSYKQCHSSSKKHARRKDNKKLGAAMMMIGLTTVLAIFLPIKYWAVLLSIAIFIFGILLIKK